MIGDFPRARWIPSRPLESNNFREEYSRHYLPANVRGWPSCAVSDRPVADLILTGASVSLRRKSRGRSRSGTRVGNRGCRNDKGVFSLAYATPEGLSKGSTSLKENRRSFFS